MGDSTLLTANIAFPIYSPEKGSNSCMCQIFYQFTIILFLVRELQNSGNLSTENFFACHYEFYSSCFVFFRPYKHLKIVHDNFLPHQIRNRVQNRLPFHLRSL